MSPAEEQRREALVLTGAAITSIVAHRLHPRDYDTTTAGRLLATTVRERHLSGEHAPLTVADLWEVLAGDWDPAVPLSDHAAAAAWDIADSYTTDNDYGGPIDAPIPATTTVTQPQTAHQHSRPHLNDLLQATHRPTQQGTPNSAAPARTPRHAAPDPAPELHLEAGP